MGLTAIYILEHLFAICLLICGVLYVRHIVFDEIDAPKNVRKYDDFCNFS